MDLNLFSNQKKNITHSDFIKRLYAGGVNETSTSDFLDFDDEEGEYEEEDDDYLSSEDIVSNIFYQQLLPLIVDSSIPDDAYLTDEMEMFETKQAKIIFKNGNFYEGEISNSRFNGKGIFQWSDGARFEGNFYRNYARGIGTFTNPEEDYYSGHFNQGVSSHGVSTLKNKRFNYKGSFLNGHFHGKGILEASPLRFDGEFSVDLPVIGIRTYENGIFVGQFDEHGYRKYGKYQFNNNDYYYGHWYDDKYNDFGVYHWENGHFPNENVLITYKEIYYSGFWVQGNRNGVGLLRFEEILLISKWKLDKKCGYGLLRAANGQIFVGNDMFVNNQYNMGFLLIINAETKTIVRNLLNLPNKFDGRNSCHLTDTKSDNYMQCQDILINNIKQLMLETEGYSKYTPYFLPNYEIEKNIACLVFLHTLPKSIGYISTEIELKTLRQTVKRNFHDINFIYLKYANFNFNMTNSDLESCKYNCMNRLGLWLFYQDVFLKMPRINIMDNIEICDDLYNLLPKDPLDQTEPVYFWEFLRHLFHIVVILNKTYCTILEHALNEKAKIFGLFPTMLLIFLREYSVINKTQIPLSWKLITECPNIIKSLLRKINNIKYTLTIREAYKFFHNIKSVRDKRIKNDDVYILDYVVDHDFIDCCTRIFPKMNKDNILIDTCFNITPLQLCQIIYLCFDRQIYLRINASDLDD